MKKQLLLLYFLALPFLAFSQAHVMRNFQASPFLDTTGTSSTERTYFAATNFAAHNSRGFQSTENSQGWNAQVCGMFDIVRWKSKKNEIGLHSFVLFSSIEVSANIYNNIAFNPRGIILQESFAYFNKKKNFTWNVGFTHKSRHEIDSDSPPNDTTSRIGYQPTSRVAILNGPHIEITTDKINLSPSVTTNLWGRAEYYTISDDSRFPRFTEEQSWDFMSGMILLGGRIDIKLSKGNKNIWGFYNRSWANTAIFSNKVKEAGGKNFKFNYRTETGFDFKGAKASAEAFIAREHFFDDLSSPRPVASTVWLVGARVRGFLFL
ncbi:hypothetical protein [Bernardetia sp.]|uniref:hypothetical protein n=1 Tax=Bernardetia sp. TaxID=1937974 RepID=UPI0025C30934|nr:hypothetical protein [Bernardetia sp.]